jgi:anti-anti-sigma factor
MDNKIIEVNSTDVIIMPKENIDYSNSQKFKEILQKLFEQNYKKIIIDFSEIERIDSSGLGKILLFQKKLKERNGDLIITNVKNDYIKNMFEMIHLNKVITIRD